LKEEVDNECWLCKPHEETTVHLTSGCPIMEKNEYFTTHYKVGANLHYSICKALGIKRQLNGKHTHTHTHTPVCEHEDVTLLWNQGVHTDREVTANRPDIIIKNKKEKTCVLIEVVIPVDRNVTQKEAENKLK
jgi:hypothetical protein